MPSGMTTSGHGYRYFLCKQLEWK